MTITSVNQTGGKSVTIDDILTTYPFGIFSRYHAFIGFLLFLSNMTTTLTGDNYIFAAEKVNYRCKNSLNTCDVRPMNGSQHDNFDAQCYERVTVGSEISCESVNNSTVVPCQEWTFEDPKSLVAELHLECEEWKRTLIGTVHSFGYMLGLLIIGPISDKIGRKKVLVTTGMIGGILGMVKSFINNYWVYIGLEIVEAAIGETCSPAFMLAMEIVAAKDRSLYYMWTQFGFQMGNFVMALISWQFPYWRHLLRVLHVPSLLFIFYVFLIDESPRWLLTKGRKDEAVVILQKSAKFNKIYLDKAMLDNLTCEVEEKPADVGYRELLKTTFASNVLLRRFLVCAVWWTTGTFVNYGLSINSVLLSGNKYINFVLLALVDIPASVLMGYTLIYYKRKKPLFISFFGAAIFFSIQPYLPTGITWLSVSCLMLGKFMSSIYFSITYVYTSELFPTHTRNSMHALCSSIGRIGSMLAPQTPLLIPIWSGLPSMLFAGMSLFAAIVTCLVPDTASVALPDTVHQAEAVGRGAEDKVQMDTVHHAETVGRGGENKVQLHTVNHGDDGEDREDEN